MARPIDRCPKWAEDLILKIRALEIQLGNVRPGMGTKADEDWQAQHFSKLAAKLSDDSDDEARHAEAAVEALFKKIAKGLSEEPFTVDEIAQFINARVAPESRLPYCNAAEVSEALASH